MNAKKILTCILAGSLALFMVLYCFTSIIFKTMDPRKWNVSTSQEQTGNKSNEEQTEENTDEAATGGHLTLDKAKGNGITLTSTSIPVELYSDYGIDPMSVKSAHVLQATLNPADCVSTDFTWAVVFKDPSSSWANGKEVSDYVELTQYGGTNLNCTLTCKQAFGEPIEVSITYDYDKSITSSVQADYVKRVTNITLSGFSSTKFNDGDECNLKLEATYGVGTVQGNLTIDESWGEFAGEFELWVTDTVCAKYYGPFDDGTYDGYYASFCSSSKRAGNAVSGQYLELNYKSFFQADSGFPWVADAVENAYACYWLAFNKCRDKNVLRAAATYSYTYSGAVISTDTVYTAYGEIDLGNLENKFFTLNDVDLGDNFYF